MAKPYVLHGMFLSGPTYKVGLMLRLCGLPFTYHHIDMAKGEHKRPAYLAINRYGQVPALSIGDAHLCQSNSILLYLAEQEGKFLPADALGRQRVREWLDWEQDRLFPGVVRSRFFNRFLKPEPEVIDYFAKAAHAGLAALDPLLAGRQWLATDAPTVADIAIYATVQQAIEGNIALDEYGQVTAWMQRVEGLPRFGRPGDILPKSNQEVAAQ